MKNYYKKHNQPSLRARRINDMLILVFIALNKAAPSYMSDLFTELQTSISLRGKRSFVIPRLNTTNYGLHSLDIMPVNCGTYCRLMSVCLLLLLPSKLH